MSIDYIAFAATFPEFATDDPAGQVRIEQFIGFAAAECPASKYGSDVDEAVLWLAAHKLALANRRATGGSGAVASVKMSKLAVTYATPTEFGSSLESTQYGAEFMRLRRRKAFTPVVTGTR